MSSNLEEDVALFKILRERLLGRLDEQEADLRLSLEKTRDAKRNVLGHGARGSASEPGSGTQGDRILAWLRANPGPRAIAEISSGVGLERLAVNQALIALNGARLVRRPVRGRYEAAGPPLLPAHHADAPSTVDPSTDAPPTEGPPRRETPADRMRRMRQAGTPSAARPGRGE